MGGDSRSSDDGGMSDVAGMENSWDTWVGERGEMCPMEEQGEALPDILRGPPIPTPPAPPPQPPGGGQEVEEEEKSAECWEKALSRELMEECVGEAVGE